MNQTRSLIILALISTILVAVSGGIIYRQQVHSLKTQIARTFRVSAVELSSQLSIPVKVNNYHDIKRIVSNSYIRAQSEFLVLSDAAGQSIISFPEEGQVLSLTSCTRTKDSVDILFAQEKIGSIGFCYDLERLSRLDLSLSLYLALVGAIVALTVILWLWYRHGTNVMQKFLQGLDEIDLYRPSLGPTLATGRFESTDLFPVYEKVRLLLRRLSDVAEERQALEADRAFLQVSQQVSHDIRSPLVALRVLLGDVPEVSAEKRMLLQSAVTRIQDIVTDLDQKRKRIHYSPSESEFSHSTFLYPLVESVVNEKKLLASGIEIDLKVDRASLSALVSGEMSPIQRLLSNIIQNSIEAMEAVCKEKGGQILVELSVHQNKVEIKVADQGCGIPADILPRVFERGFSFGKIQGSGLGLSQVKETVERRGGRVEIQSYQNQGTQMIVHLPMEIAPAWLPASIALEPSESVVILDDDPSIHDLWKKKLSGRVQILSFYNADEFRQWWMRGQSKLPSLILIDYQLGVFDPSGIDIVKEFSLAAKAILVTSKYDDSNIQKECLRMGLRLLPKYLVPSIEIIDSKAVA